MRIPLVTCSKRVAAASLTTAHGSRRITRQSVQRSGAARRQRRSRAAPLAATRWCSFRSLWSASGSKPGGSGIAVMSAVSTTTTSGAALGDHSAGQARGSASGGVGKAQPPPPGQTLPFGWSGGRVLGNSILSFGMIAAIVGIALQELLRKIRIVVVSVLIGGLMRPPRNTSGHRTPAKHRRTGQALSVCSTTIRSK
jgi:hypothetical protein